MAKESVNHAGLRGNRLLSGGECAARFDGGVHESSGRGAFADGRSRRWGPPTFTLQVETIHDIVCKTTGLIAAAPYPRLAVVHGHTSLLFDAAGEYGQRLMYSTDSSVSFSPFDVHSQDGSSSGVVFANASSSTALPLVANTQYDFGIGLFSISGSATTTTKMVMGTTVGSHCQLMVEVFNQNGTSSPF
jgi:hypothetical protein